MQLTSNKMSRNDYSESLLVHFRRIESLRRKALSYPLLDLNNRQLCDLELLLNRAFYPLSGYVSQAAGQEIYVLENRCLGQGHAACHLQGRTREEWGEEHAGELAFFEPGRLAECLAACPGLEVWRPPAIISAEPDLRPRGHRSRPVHPGRLGGPLGGAARTAGRGHRAACAGWAGDVCR